jgi:hypothetical protein
MPLVQAAYRTDSVAVLAPRSRSQTSTSSQLAAQCRGVSLCGPVNLACASAPAATSAATVAARPS